MTLVSLASFFNTFKVAVDFVARTQGSKSLTTLITFYLMGAFLPDVMHKQNKLIMLSSKNYVLYYHFVLFFLLS